MTYNTVQRHGGMTQAEAETSSFEGQHAEVEAVVAAFSRAPLMARLFLYLCEKCFAGEAEELNEVKIAADVFNRFERFDRTRDSIARVEVHRLRKKLKQYYESEGKSHAVKIEIPPGSYAPIFRYIEKPEQDTTRIDTLASASDGAKEEPLQQNVALLQELEVAKNDCAGGSIAPPLAPGKPKRVWVSALIGISVLVLCVYLVVYLGSRFLQGSGGRASSTSDVGRVAAAAGGAATAASGPIRVLCGYAGPPHIGRLGEVWGPDQDFHGGRPWPVRTGFARRASDPFLFKNTRTGEFSYDIPVNPGVYELHLYFIETEYGEELGGGENSRTFMIRLNGATLIQTFDPISDAGGARIADERVFKDIRPASDGKVHVSVESQRGEPMISAIELLPGIPHRQIPVRIATQINSYTDHLGHVWSPDNYYLGGVIQGGKPPVTNTYDPALFTSERMGNFTYAIPVDTNSTYTVNLYFAETYFGPTISGVGGTGSRVFNVSCNGNRLLDHFDILREAGGLHALIKSFHGLTPNAQGKLMLAFEPVANYATVFGIEAVDESRSELYGTGW
jgi:hypothetical protein